MLVKLIFGLSDSFNKTIYITINLMMKNIRIVALLWLIFTIPNSLFAQTETGVLKDLWEKVESKYPGVSSQDSKVDAAKLNEKAVKGERLPQLRTQAQNTYGTYEGTVGAFFPQAGLFNVSGSDQLTGASFSPNTYASATLEWEFFAFGKQKNKTKAAKSNTSKINSQREAYLLELKKDLSIRYLNLLYNESQLSWNNKNVERLQAITNITSALANAGIKSHADSLLASSSYNQALGENEKLKGQNSAALIQLLELTGTENLIIEQSKENFLNPQALLPTQTSDIQSNHPVLSSVEATKKQLEYQGKTQKNASLPSINLLGGVAYRGTGIGADGVVSDKWKDGFSNNANNALIGVGITWNITDLYTQNKKGNSLLKDAESLGYMHQQYELSMQSDLEATQNKISQQYIEVMHTKKAHEQAESAYEMYLARYKSGLMDLSTLLQIQQLLEQAENKHINAAFNYWKLLAVEAELIADFDHLFNNL